MTSDNFNDSSPLGRLSLQSHGDKVFSQLILRQFKKFAFKRNGMKKAERWNSIWFKGLILSNNNYINCRVPINSPFGLCTTACMPFLKKKIKNLKLWQNPHLLHLFISLYYIDTSRWKDSRTCFMCYCPLRIHTHWHMYFLRIVINKM